MASVSATGAGFKPSFHFWIVAILFAYVFTGFGITYFVPTAMGTRPPDSFVVHLHGFAWFSWMLLLAMQALLIGARKVKWHRSLGTFGIAVGTFAALMAATIVIVAASTTQLQGVGREVFWLNVTAPPSFALLFALGIRASKKPVVHRSLMLLATITIIMPGMNRVYMNGLGIEHFTFIETYVSMDVLTAALLWHERKTTGTISGLTWFGAAVVVVPQFLLWPVTIQDWWPGVVFWLGSLVEYH